MLKYKQLGTTENKLPYSTLKCLHGFTFAVFADWKPFMKVYTRENLDPVLVQWQNAKKIAKSQNPLNMQSTELKAHMVF